MKAIKIISLVLCAVMFISCADLSAYAYTASEIQDKIDELENQRDQIKNDIKKLQNDKTKQNELKAALDKEIANVQAQIGLCNEKISQTNKTIAENEEEIAKKQSEMNTAIFEYKKRIRTIYMSSSTGNGLEILLGAESFGDFISLSQATLNISRRDKRMVDDIVSMINEIEEKLAENKKLIDEQKKLKETLSSKEQELDKQVAEVLKVISKINSDITDGNNSISKAEDDIKEWNDAMAALSKPSDSGGSTVFDGMFTWPVPGFTSRTSEYGERWNRQHAGIDIAQGGIANAKVVAIGSGTAYVWCNTCTHNYGKYSNGTIYSCGCGGGYGNYLSIDHGTYKGIAYKSVYAHLAPGSITVSTKQKVSRGQVIGKVGTTGRSSGYHLHFEIREDGVPKNPMNYYS